MKQPNWGFAILLLLGVAVSPANSETYDECMKNGGITRCGLIPVDNPKWYKPLPDDYSRFPKGCHTFRGEVACPNKAVANGFVHLMERDDFPFRDDLINTSSVYEGVFEIYGCDYDAVGYYSELYFVFKEVCNPGEEIHFGILREDEQVHYDLIPYHSRFKLCQGYISAFETTCMLTEMMFHKKLELQRQDAINRAIGK